MDSLARVVTNTSNIWTHIRPILQKFTLAFSIKQRIDYKSSVFLHIKRFKIQQPTGSLQWVFLFLLTLCLQDSSEVIGSSHIPYVNEHLWVKGPISVICSEDSKVDSLLHTITWRNSLSVSTFNAQNSKPIFSSIAFPLEFSSHPIIGLPTRDLIQSFSFTFNPMRLITWY